LVNAVSPARWSWALTTRRAASCGSSTAPDTPGPAATTRNGYHVVFWRDGNLVLCAVSDTGWDELSALQRLLSEKTIPGGRE